MCSAPGEDSEYDEVIKERIRKAFYAGFTLCSANKARHGLSKQISIFDGWLKYISQDGIKSS